MSKPRIAKDKKQWDEMLKKDWLQYNAGCAHMDDEMPFYEYILEHMDTVTYGMKVSAGMGGFGYQLEKA